MSSTPQSSADGWRQSEHSASALISSIDWAQTPLGCQENWPTALRATTELVLACSFPMVLLWGPDLVQIYNDSYAAIMGTKHPLGMGQPTRECWPEVWQFNEPVYRQVLAGETLTFENQLFPITRHGYAEDAYFTLCYSPLRCGDGTSEVAGALVTVFETTLQIRAEAAQRQVQQDLQNMIDSTPQISWAADSKGDVLHFGKQWSDVTGLSPDETRSEQRFAAVHPDDLPALHSAWEHSIKTGESFDYEHRVATEGTYRWMRSRAKAFHDDGGSVLRWYGTTEDIEERKRTEEELRYRREEIQLALDAAALASWYYDPVREVVGGDARMRQLFGLSSSEAPASVWIDTILEEDRDRVAAAFAGSVNGEPYDIEFRVQRDGDACWVRSRARTVFSEGKLTRLVGICEDVSSRKARDRETAATLERLALSQQVGNIAAWEWDLKTDLLTWDAASRWVYGRPPSEVDHMAKIAAVLHKDDLARVIESTEPVKRGEADYDTEFRVCWPDGSTHWLIGRGKPIRDEDGKVVRINGVNIDITDRRLAEARLRQSEKLAAVGQLASTIAHEINNPLESVTNLLYICNTTTDNPDLLTYLSMAEVELRRISAITNQTLRFHKQQTHPKAITCVDLFSSSLLIFQGRIQNSNIQVAKRKRAEQPVMCLEGEIRQVMNNLIGNAIDAMKLGGTLAVRSAEGTDWRTGRRGLRLTVADTGTGISPQMMRNLFQPFNTSKGIGGTGLGLWISREIVERHRGHLLVKTSTDERHHGTVFNLFLPFDFSADEASA